MKKLFILPLLIFFQIFAFSQTVPESKTEESFFTPKYFNMLREYINTTGKVYNVDVSGIKNGGMIVTYHSITHNNWSITVDHSHRIYFSTLKDSAEKHFGNILLENNKVLVEITYGLGRKQTKEEIKEEHVKKQILTKEYNSILKEIVTVQNE